MKMKKVLSLMIASLALAALSQPAAAGKFYRWTDAKGVTHYTLKAPEDGIPYTVVDTWNSTSSDQADALERLERQRENAREEREERAAEQSAEKNPEKATADRCARHRENLNTLENKAVIRTKDPETGEYTTLSAEQKEQMLEQTRQALKLCEGAE